MTHITIRLVSPPTGSKSIREIIRIKTPESLLPLRDISESVVVETEENSAGMRDTCCEDKTKQVTLCKFQAGNAEGNSLIHVSTNGDSWSGDDSNRVQQSSSSQINRHSGETMRNGTLKKLGTDDGNSLVKCDSCGRLVDPEEFESELYITRKDLASVESQLETFKSRLEEELIERFKVEEELKSEAEAHESEMHILKEKIDCLEGNERDKAKKVEELENMISVYREEHEKGWEELDHLREFVCRYQTEVSKLRAEANNANDQAVEAMNEMELLTKKTERNEHEKDKIRKQLRSDMETYWREIRELRNALENWEELDVEKKTRIRSLEKEVTSHKQLVDELREELTAASNRRSTDKDTVNSAKDSTKSEELFALCHELNDVYREHLSSQGKFSELSLVLVATQKELEEARNRSEDQNLAQQEFKQKYNDLHDTMVALKEENRHLRNGLEKKCAEFREVRRKFLVSETEVSWLKEALNIVDDAKKRSLCSSMEVVDVQA